MRLFFIFLLIGISGSTLAQQKYHYVNLSTDKLSTSFKPLEEAVKQKKYFFSGENHMFSTSNSNIELKLFKYLNKQANVNHFLVEFGYGTGWVINKYINDSIKEIDSIVYRQFNDDFIALFDSLKNYNKKLKEKFMVHGVDIQRSNELAFEMLYYLLPNEKQAVPDSIEKEIDLIRYVQGYVKQTADNSIKLKRSYSIYELENILRKNFKAHTELYKTYLGKNFTDFEKCILSFFDGVEWKRHERKETPFATLYREEKLYQNFKSLANEFPKEHFYGQFGRAHISQVRYTSPNLGTYNFEPMVAKINSSQDTLIANKTLSIGIFYANSDGSDYYEIYQNDAIQKTYSDLKKDCVILVNTSQEKQLDSTLKAWYPFIIVNNKSLYKEAKGAYDVGYFGLELTYGLTEIDLAATNDFFGTVFFRNYIDVFSGHFFSYKDFGPYVDFGGSYYYKNSSNIGINDSISADWNGWDIYYTLGYDLIKSKYVDFIPAARLTYMRSKLKIDETNGTPFTGIDAINYDFVKNSFLLDAKANLKIRLARSIRLSFHGGYRWDFGGKKWRYNGDRTNASQDYSGLYFSAGVSFMMR